MSLKRFVYFTFVILLFSSCSTARTTILQNNAIPTDKSAQFYLFPLQIGPTFSDSSRINNNLKELSQNAREILSENNISLAPAKTAVFLIRISVETLPRTDISKDEVRFMKGAHNNGSIFPDQNPRAQNLEADFLSLQITQIESGNTVFSAKCQLIVNQRPDYNPPIETENFISCLNEIIPQF